MKEKAISGSEKAGEGVFLQYEKRKKKSIFWVKVFTY